MTDKQKQIIKLYKLGRSKLGISKDIGVTRAYVYEFLVKEGLFKTKAFPNVKRRPH